MDFRANTVVRGSGRSFSQAQFWKNASFSSLPGLNWRNLDRHSDLECYYTSALAPRAATPVTDGKPLKSARKPQVGMADAEEDEPIRFHKDLSLLPILALLLYLKFHYPVASSLDSHMEKCRALDCSRSLLRCWRWFKSSGGLSGSSRCI